MENIELLSPAKDLETGIAAINCGADAVYLGAANYGARKAAGNSLQDIQRLADYAHKYWARVYVTVNTLLYDNELPDAEQLIKQLYQIGVDAVIIQDFGLLELDLPPIPLFASTQMHNHTSERVAFLEKVGFQRVILARELSLEQIQHIRRTTNIELETFIHGALCVSYSGQCYMSYAIGGRSGNRGQCAQPCRLKYSLVDGRGNLIADRRYLLSLRDLNLSHSLAVLVDAGVCSFKIEGRLKNKAYVMNIVGYYRQLLDK
ncbi:MAG: peptidase U32 family protein, partial [Anaerolineaceae bacterium]|nr:peptidase U32 family protein [Anaerolineaceae bacterium]